MAKRRPTKPTAIRARFGERLRELRKARGLTLEELGERAGVDAKYVGALETARSAATVDMIGKLADGLGVEAAELFVAAPERPVDAKKTAARLLSTVGEDEARRIVRVISAMVSG